MTSIPITRNRNKRQQPASTLTHDDLERMVNKAVEQVETWARLQAARDRQQLLDQMIEAARQEMRAQLAEVKGQVLAMCYRPEHVADILNVSSATVRQWIREEGLPIVQINARVQLIPRHALQAWVDSRTAPIGAAS